jgi:hypothetical protein
MPALASPPEQALDDFVELATLPSTPFTLVPTSPIATMAATAMHGWSCRELYGMYRIRSERAGR